MIVLWAVLGGLWRIVLGGLFGLPRWACVASYALILAPAWFLADWRFVLFAHAFAALYWLPGHHWDSLWSMVKRYGPVIGTVWYWFANKLPDSWHPTRIAEFTASFLYHLALFTILT